MAKLRQDIKVHCENENEADLVCRFLQTYWHLDASDWDIYERHPMVVEGSCYVTGYYEKPVLYTKNGDGSPGGWFIEDGIVEDDLEKEILERMQTKVKVRCEIGGSAYGL